MKKAKNKTGFKFYPSVDCSARGGRGLPSEETEKHDWTQNIPVGQSGQEEGLVRGRPAHHRRDPSSGQWRDEPVHRRLHSAGRKWLWLLPSATHASGHPCWACLYPGVRVPQSDGCQMVQLHRDRVTKLLRARVFFFIFVIIFYNLIVVSHKPVPR